jgi:hypothetical protein
MLKNIRPYQISALCLVAIGLTSFLISCVLDDRVSLEPGSYVPVPGSGTAGPVALLEVDRDDQQAVFYLEDGSREAVSFVARDRSDWPSGCPTNINSTYMDVLDIDVETLALGGLTFNDPILVRDCPAEPERIALRDDGPVGGGGGACVGVDSCLLFDRQSEAAPVPAANIVTSEPSPPPPTGESQPVDNLSTGVKLEAELQVPASLPNGDVVKLNFSLANHSDRPVYLLKWFTPLEGIGGDIFRVRRDGQLVPYQGILASRSDPAPDAYVFLEAGETVSAEVDLAKAYDFSQDGTYTITFISPRISYLAETEAEMARTLEALGPVEIPANEVAVNIPGPTDSDSNRDLDKAQETLLRFFSLLHQGQYAEAVDLYGGPYDVLQEWNPTADPQDYVGLLARGCMANGLQCLAVKQVMAVETGSRDKFSFTVTFENPDGSLFVLNPHGTIPRSEFDYTVVRSEDDYFVEELPVYAP